MKSNKKIRYFLALGANEGDRFENIRKAITWLNQLGEIAAVSSFYESSPVGMKGSGDFINLVLEFHSTQVPSSLLRQIKEFEASCGRDIGHSHNRPRPIDIDILFAGDRIIQSEVLTVPHPRLKERAFVLIPLREIAPEFRHPRTGETVVEMAMRLPPGQKINRVEAPLIQGVPEAGGNGGKENL